MTGLFQCKPINERWKKFQKNLFAGKFANKLFVTQSLAPNVGFGGGSLGGKKTKYNKHNRNSLASNLLECIGKTAYERTMKTGFVLCKVERFRDADYKDWN